MLRNLSILLQSNDLRTVEEYCYKIFHESCMQREELGTSISRTIDGICSQHTVDSSANYDGD